jgi:hypothetical protein
VRAGCARVLLSFGEFVLGPSTAKDAQIVLLFITVRASGGPRIYVVIS